MWLVTKYILLSHAVARKTLYLLLEGSQSSILKAFTGKALCGYDLAGPGSLSCIVKAPSNERILLVHLNERVGVVALHIREGVIDITVMCLVGHLK